jgi:predicted NAD-dependent protein-ADP-ribosyltransferase YbiA (DUF1768 family)
MDKKISTKIKSSVAENVYYKQDKKINPLDKGSYADLYQLFLFDKEVIVALGNKIYDNYDKNLISIPIYLVFENVEKIQKIGFFEIKANEYSQSLKGDRDINLNILDEPLLFNYVDKDFIDDLMDEESIDYFTEESDDEEDYGMVKFTREEDDNIDKPGETEEDYKKIKKNYVKRENDPWVKTYFLNNNYGIKDNDAGGDCFFYTVEQAFDSINIKLPVDKQRDMISDKLNKDQFTTYKKLYEELNSSIHNNGKNVDRLIKINKKLKDEYDAVIRKIKSKEVSKDGKLKKDLRKKANKIALENRKNKKKIEIARKENEQSETTLQDFEFMKGVNNLDKLKNVVKTCSFWADTYAIQQLELTLNIKFIILSNDNYFNGSHTNIIQCGDMVPVEIEERKSYNPKYYIIVDHGSVHYRLISYKELSIFQFHELPWNLKDMLVKKCLGSKGKNIYEYIPKFKKLIDKNISIKKAEEPTTTQESVERDKSDMGEKEVEDEIENEVEIVPTPSPGGDELFTEDIQFVFHSKSPNKYPGTHSTKSWSEQMPLQYKGEYEELSKIKDWRRTLSNFAIAPFKDDNDKQWQTVEHYFHAHKFIEKNPEFADKFSLNSGSEICRDPVRAKTVGGKSGKYLDVIDGKRKYIQYRSKDIVMEASFYDVSEDGKSKAERVMEAGQMFKYSQNEDAKRVLLLTKNAKLLHLQKSRGSKSSLIPFHDTMRIRKKLMGEKKKTIEKEIEINK